MVIIDAHSHLWMRQNTIVDGQPIRTLSPNGSRSTFFGQEVQKIIGDQMRVRWKNS